MSRTPLVMIVDEDQAHRQDLQALLTAERMVVVASCGYGLEAASLAEETKPEIILVAIDEPLVRPLQTLESLRAVLPASAVLGYSSSPELALVRRAMQAGARDLLVRPLRRPELIPAIETAMRSLTPSDDAPVAGTVLTVFGAKGGIGKTTISTNLALALARGTSNSVLLVDLDTRFGDVAIMLDVAAENSVSELAAQVSTLDRESFREALVRHKSGAYVLPAPSHPNEWRTVQPEDVRALVALAARTFDYVILDTPGAFNDIVGVALDSARQVLVVTSVDIASIKDTAFVLDVLKSESFPDDRLFLTVNHANVASTIGSRDVSNILGRPVFWEVPYDPQIALSTQLGEPIVMTNPRSKGARTFTDFAALIAGVPATRARPTLLSRISRRAS